jgi:SAM-dependent methyltransferase
MRRDVLQLRDFYATPLGAATRAVVARKLAEAWGDTRGLDVLGLGYATPYLEDFRRDARRVVATMPAAQGVERWPGQGRTLVCLGDETALPFVNALFDRVLLIHTLEETDDPLSLMREAWRVLAPAGRLIVVAASRRGFWSDAESTPFGHGRPFTRRQLETLVREAELEPIAWSRALFAPPFQWAASWVESLEPIGARLWPALSGLIMLEAVKQTFAVKPKGRRATVRPAVAGILRPTPVRKSQNNP